MPTTTGEGTFKLERVFGTGMPPLLMYEATARPSPEKIEDSFRSIFLVHGNTTTADLKRFHFSQHNNNMFALCNWDDFEDFFIKNDQEKFHPESRDRILLTATILKVCVHNVSLKKDFMRADWKEFMNEKKKDFAANKEPLLVKESKLWEVTEGKKLEVSEYVRAMKERTFVSWLIKYIAAHNLESEFRKARDAVKQHLEVLHANHEKAGKISKSNGHECLKEALAGLCEQFMQFEGNMNTLQAFTSFLKQCKAYNSHARIPHSSQGNWPVLKITLQEMLYMKCKGFIELQTLGSDKLEVDMSVFDKLMVHWFNAATLTYNIISPQSIQYSIGYILRSHAPSRYDVLMNYVLLLTPDQYDMFSIVSATDRKKKSDLNFKFRDANAETDSTRVTRSRTVVSGNFTEGNLDEYLPTMNRRNLQWILDALEDSKWLNDFDRRDESTFHYQMYIAFLVRLHGMTGREKASVDKRNERIEEIQQTLSTSSADFRGIQADVENMCRDKMKAFLEKAYPYHQVEMKLQDPESALLFMCIVRAVQSSYRSRKSNQIKFNRIRRLLETTAAMTACSPSLHVLWKFVNVDGDGAATKDKILATLLMDAKRTQEEAKEEDQRLEQLIKLTEFMIRAVTFTQDVYAEDSIVKRNELSPDVREELDAVLINNHLKRCFHEHTCELEIGENKVTLSFDFGDLDKGKILPLHLCDETSFTIQSLLLVLPRTGLDKMIQTLTAMTKTDSNTATRNLAFFDVLPSDCDQTLCTQSLFKGSSLKYYEQQIVSDEFVEKWLALKPAFVNNAIFGLATGNDHIAGTLKGLQLSLENDSLAFVQDTCTWPKLTLLHELQTSMSLVELMEMAIRYAKNSFIDSHMQSSAARITQQEKIVHYYPRNSKLDTWLKFPNRLSWNVLLEVDETFQKYINPGTNNSKIDEQDDKEDGGDKTADTGEKSTSATDNADKGQTSGNDRRYTKADAWKVCERFAEFIEGALDDVIMYAQKPDQDKWSPPDTEKGEESSSESSSESDSEDSASSSEEESDEEKSDKKEGGNTHEEDDADAQTFMGPYIPKNTADARLVQTVYMRNHLKNFQKRLESLCKTDRGLSLDAQIEEVDAADSEHSLAQAEKEGLQDSSTAVTTVEVQQNWLDKNELGTKFDSVGPNYAYQGFCQVNWKLLQLKHTDYQSLVTSNIQQISQVPNGIVNYLHVLVGHDMIEILHEYIFIRTTMRTRESTMRQKINGSLIEPIIKMANGLKACEKYSRKCTSGMFHNWGFTGSTQNHFKGDADLIIDIALCELAPPFSLDDRETQREDVQQKITRLKSSFYFMRKMHEYLGESEKPKDEIIIKYILGTNLDQTEKCNTRLELNRVNLPLQWQLMLSNLQDFRHQYSLLQQTVTRLCTMKGFMTLEQISGTDPLSNNEGDSRVQKALQTFLAL